jgi:hypothetical protein
VPQNATEQSALTAEEIVERLIDSWMLQLNIDPRTNVDEQGRDLGFTVWRMVARCVPEEEEAAVYAEILLVSDCLENAEALAVQAVNTGSEVPQRPLNGWLEVHVPSCERLTPERAAQILEQAEPVAPTAEKVLKLTWYTDRD